MTDYRKPLSNFRLEADNFDYDAYLKDEANGVFDSKPNTVDEFETKEGLMRRTMISSMKDKEKEPFGMERPVEESGGLGSIARRFIEIRKRRRQGFVRRNKEDSRKKTFKDILKSRSTERYAARLKEGLMSKQLEDKLSSQPKKKVVKPKPRPKKPIPKIKPKQRP